MNSATPSFQPPRCYGIVSAEKLSTLHGHVAFVGGKFWRDGVGCAHNAMGIMSVMIVIACPCIPTSV